MSKYKDEVSSFDDCNIYYVDFHVSCDVHGLQIVCLGSKCNRALSAANGPDDATRRSTSNDSSTDDDARHAWWNDARYAKHDANGWEHEPFGWHGRNGDDDAANNDDAAWWRIQHQAIILKEEKEKAFKVIHSAVAFEQARHFAPVRQVCLPG